MMRHTSDCLKGTTPTVQDTSLQRSTHKAGVAALTATGTGTAMASISAIGVLNIEMLAGGLWSVAAILAAGLICFWLANVFAHLSARLPTSASLLTYAIRGLGARYGMLLIFPYFMAMVLLGGFEALIVGALMNAVLTLPTLVGAGLFLIGTWTICRSGIRVGYCMQVVATSVLFALIVGLCIVQALNAADAGLLDERLLPIFPGTVAFVAAVGQAMFLFMGFELITSHAEVAREGSIRPSLRRSVLLLIAFYAVLAVGLASMPSGRPDAENFLVPQLTLASQAGVPGMLLAVTLVCLLASFTSYNGALLGLSRFLSALARQGILHRRLADLDPRTLTARPALAALLCTTLILMVAIDATDLYKPSILAAAAIAAVAYAAMTLLRERPPFLEQERGGVLRVLGVLIALLLLGLTFGVVAEAGGAQSRVIAIIAVLFLCAASMTRNLKYGRERAGTLGDSSIGSRIWRSMARFKWSDS